MTGESRRHVLVVGAQCTAMGTLTRLEDAAASLHTVLTDPALGACRPRPGRLGSLLIGAELEPEDVRKAVHEAVRRAKADGAVLVVALLGHGFTPPQQTELYYMVARSTTASTMSAVNVRHLLAEAADEPGVEGVIALIDTCHASGAVPDAGSIAGGVRAGRTRLSVLTASAADQAARDMRLTFALTDVLREGLRGADASVYVDVHLTEALRGRVAGQVVGGFAYDNDPFALDGLWLARNARRTPGTGDGVVGPVGRQDLEEAVSMWRADTRLPARLSLADLDALHRFADEGQVDDALDPWWRTRVTDVVATLQECARTVSLLNRVLTDVLASDLLREARRLSGLPHTAEGPELLRDLVEYAALRSPIRGEPQWCALARFLAALAHVSADAGVVPRLRDWAQRHGVVTAFNDALKKYARQPRRGRLRLVVSLAGALTGWPEEVDAWLVGCEEHPVHRRFRCESADRAGAGRAIGAALAWSRGRLPAPEELVHVDVAAPAHLLARWQPEEARVGRHLLGVHNTVVVRWSGRMDPAEENAEINDAARKALRDMRAGGSPAVKWIDAAVLGDRQALEQSLTTGQYDTVVGIDHHPESLQDVLEQLLPYAPVLLWPRPEARPGDGRLRALVREHWHDLPDGLADAYRRRWSREHEGCAACLGDVRAVWHDEAWLEFCRPFEKRVVTGPEEE
ncbi:caspase family protein [Streptomyces sp. NPDC017966]|uniref:vWA-MoxR associated conflict system protein n=1 Tax=Streptomyces sp. NPDC017966 TaxID=3365023 RepID=UPI00378B4A4F